MGRRLRGGRRRTYFERMRKCQPPDASSSPSFSPDDTPSIPSDSPVALEVESRASSSDHIQQCDRLPHLNPITSYSSLSDLNNVVLPSGVATSTHGGSIIRNSSVIEILVHLLCREYEPNLARRERLSIALCKVIKQWNSSLYLPLHTFPEHQDFRSGLLRKFEFFFKQVQSQISPDAAKLFIPSVQLPATGSPLTQLALTDTYQHQLVDDRYSREFEEVTVLGSGGFGVVVKARNRLDGRVYAIKIIIMDKQDGETNTKLLREVQALAQLDHPNVVRYHSTWLQLFIVPPHLWPKNGTRKFKQRQPRPYNYEEVEINGFYSKSQVKIQELSSSPELDEMEESSGGIVFMDVSKTKSSLFCKKSNRCDTILESGESTYDSRTGDYCSNRNTESLPEMSSLNNSTTPEMSSLNNSTTNFSSHIFKSEISERNRSSCSKFFKEDSSFSYNSVKFDDSVSKQKQEYTSTSSSGTSDCKNSLIVYNRHPADAQMTLFIQMGICGDTLAYWISERNASSQGKDVDSKLSLNLFRQILLAVQYIHSKKIIHRDLKPSNIFFTQDREHVQLGDFGLARSLPEASPSENIGKEGTSEICLLSTVINNTANSAGVGTPIYAPPELKFGGVYGSESDMHNLGIILLELFYPFQTGSERIQVITNLKSKGVLETDFMHRWPDIVPWILKLTDRDRTKRPTASDLLESELFSSEYATYAGSENNKMLASNLPSLTGVGQKFQSEELPNRFDEIRISNLKVPHAENINIDRERVRNLIIENKEKDEEIRKLKLENVKLQELVDRLQKQIKQSSTS